MFNANLRRAENVTGGMQTDVHTVDVACLAICNDINRVCKRAKSLACQRRSAFRNEVRARSPREVITVRMCDDGTVDRLPWIDVEVASFAIKTCIGELEHLQKEKDRMLNDASAVLGAVSARSRSCLRMLTAVWVVPGV